MKQHSLHVSIDSKGAGAAVAREPLPQAARVQGAAYEDIARLAFKYWQARNCPVGSPEEDWFRAERELSPQGSARQ